MELQITFSRTPRASALSHANRGLLWGLLSGAAWGLDGVILGIALALAPFTGLAGLFAAPLAGAALHDGFAGFWTLLHNTAAGKWREYHRTLSTKPGLIVCVAALFGGPIAMSGYILAIYYSGACYAAAISTVYPAVGAILAVILLKERINRRVWAGILLAVAGAIIVGYNPPDGNYPNFYLGISLAVLAAVGWGIEGVLSTFGMDMIDPDIAIGIRQLVSFTVYTLVILPLAGGLIFAEVFTSPSIYYLVFAGLLGGFSYLAWYRSLNMIGVGRAMALNISYSLWAAFFAWLLVGGQLSAAFIAGAGAIVAGALLISINPRELIKLRD